jgi:ABC-type transporter Mla maintaining outer membrane lipid asymmetry permease subunit MlaE
MSGIYISRKAQLIAGLAVAGAIAAAVAAQLPEIRRYLKIEAM